MLKATKGKIIAEQKSVYEKIDLIYLATGGSKREVITKATVIDSSVPEILIGDIIYPRKYAWKRFKYEDKDLISITHDSIVAIERNGEFHAVKDMVLVKIKYKEKIGSIIVPGTRNQYRAEFLGEAISVGPEYKYGLKKGDLVYIARIEDASHEGIKIDTPQGVLWGIKSKWVVAFNGKEQA